MWRVRVAELLPGIGIATATATAAFVGSAAAAKVGRGSGASGPPPIPGIPVAVALGVAINNVVGLPTTARPGLKLCTNVLLKAGIACVGAKLSAAELAKTSSGAAPAAVATVSTGLIATPLFARAAGLEPVLGALLAAGTSICGVTAVGALAPAVKAPQALVGIAVANVVCYGTIGMLTYPYLAKWLFPEGGARAGVFLGLAVHDTAQVLGAGLTFAQAYDDESALKSATVTKLTRNLGLAVAIPVLAWVHQAKPGLAKRTPILPAFIAAFLGLAALRTWGDYGLASNGLAYGVMDEAQWRFAYKTVGDEVGAKALLGTAMAAVGLSIDAKALRGVGPRPFIVGGAAALVVGAVGAGSVVVLDRFGFFTSEEAE